MPTVHPLARRLSVALLTLGLLGAPGALGRQAAPAETLGNQLTAMSATGLKLAECEQRMQALGTMLSQAGYVSRRSHLGADAVMTGVWYHPQRQTTVVAFSGWQAADNAFSAAEMDGQVRWNELLATP
ncbi:hypothetical protein [Deinococcus marmoris]|uniref:hypothetical protein n=1 Tax=Deinococcus marmoris TaxID=249408 RepID=UPI000497384B|nr:hypothetical protein [Deinococcus marmoris]